MIKRTILCLSLLLGSMSASVPTALACGGPGMSFDELAVRSGVNTWAERHLPTRSVAVTDVILDDATHATAHLIVTVKDEGAAVSRVARLELVRGRWFVTRYGAA